MSPTGDEVRASPTGGPDIDLTIDDARPLPEGTAILTRMPFRDTEGFTNRILTMTGRGALIARQRGTGRNAPHGLVLRALTGDGPDQPVAIDIPRHHRPISAAMSRRWIAVMHAPPYEMSVLPWHLSAFDRGAGRTYALASYQRISGGDPPTPPGHSAGPYLVDGRVVWVAVEGRHGHEKTVIRSCRPARCRPRTVADGGALPAVADSEVFFVSTDRFAGRKSSDTFRVEHADPDGRHRKLITEERFRTAQSVIGLAASRRAVAWVTRVSTATKGTSEITILDRKTRQRITVDAGPEGLFGYPLATNRYVAWAEGNAGTTTQLAGYLYDLHTGRLHKFGNTAGLYDIHGAGRTLAWQVSDRHGYEIENERYLIGRLPRR